MNKCSVKGKIKCVYQSKVIAVKSGKRNDQMFKVVASEELSNNFLNHLKEDQLHASEKFDGTCCFIENFNGRPWLWGRHDIKPNKQADKRFKAHQHLKNEHELTNGDEKYTDFVWDRDNDFKEFPEDWISASGVQLENVMPDDIGHIVGWVPVDPSMRQHLWHLSAVNLNDGVGLFLKNSPADNNHIIIQLEKLENYCGKTFELIGTHVNGNPYKLGCKKNPIHVLVQHGEFRLDTFPCFETGLTHAILKSWFDEQINGHLEGIVWHSSGGKMFKLHRHHLDLKWPVDDLRIFSFPVKIDMSIYEATQHNHNRNTMFDKLKIVDGKTFENIEELSKWAIAL